VKVAVKVAVNRSGEGTPRGTREDADETAAVCYALDRDGREARLAGRCAWERSVAASGNIGAGGGLSVAWTGGLATLFYQFATSSCDIAVQAVGWTCAGRRWVGCLVAHVGEGCDGTACAAGAAPYVPCCVAPRCCCTISAVR